MMATEGKYLESTLRLSARHITYERTSYQLLDMIGEVGGFNDAIMLIIEFAMSFYVPGLFVASFVKSVFLLDQLEGSSRLSLYGSSIP